MNKKAYLKTIEAVIAVVIIFIFIFAVTPKKQEAESKVPEGIRLTQKSIINALQTDENLRAWVKGGKVEDVSNFFNDVLKGTTYDYTLVICDSEGKPCSCLDYMTKLEETDLEETDCQGGIPALPTKSIYAKSILISDGAPKILRFYIWQK